MNLHAFGPDAVDWNNCPYPPLGDKLSSDHPLYQVIYKDVANPPASIPINCSDNDNSEDLLSYYKSETGTEKEEKLVAWEAFYESNQHIFMLGLVAGFNRWYKVMGPHGRAVGPLNIYSPDVKPWEPSMGPWNAEMGPYDYLHPSNTHLPPWVPAAALQFHMFKTLHPERFPHYPTAAFSEKTEKDEPNNSPNKEIEAEPTKE